MESIAEKLGITVDDLYALIYTKFEPLQEQIEAEYKKTDEYKAKEKQRKILAKHQKAKEAFRKKYGSDDYEYCYNLWGEVVNQEYLDEIMKGGKKKQEYKDSSSYYGDWYDNYRKSSYQTASVNNYTEDEKKHLKKFYRFLSAKYHPDINHNTDDAGAMELLNKLKTEWGI